MRTIEVWNDFAEWIFYQQISAVVDFDDETSAACEASKGMTHAKCDAPNEECKMRRGKHVHQGIGTVRNVEQRKCIAEMRPNSTFVPCDMFPIVCDANSEDAN